MSICLEMGTEIRVGPTGQQAAAARRRLACVAAALTVPLVAELGDVAWPPAPIRTARLLLREPVAADRAATVELLASPQVYRHLGGPRSRADLEDAGAAVTEGRPGLLAVALDGAMIGRVTLSRRDAVRPGHVRPEGNEVELAYLFLPHAWGQGYAAEACAAALAWCDVALPDEPVVVCTQVANAASVQLAKRVGFTDVGRFDEFGAEQWFGVRPVPGGTSCGA